MKVIALNGSPRKGNTHALLTLVCEQLEKEGIETEIVEVASRNISGCTGCGACFKTKDRECIIKDDANEIIAKMIDADGIILSSPVYYSGVNGTMKSFLDRAFYVLGANGGLMRHKVGASVVAVRRSGGIPTFEQLNRYLNYSEMVVATSNYWNVAHGAAPGEVLQDPEGVQIMEVLGRNFAWLMKVLNETKVESPERTTKTFTNFIR